MANFLYNNFNAENLKLICNDEKVLLENETYQFHFHSDKKINKEILLTNFKEVFQDCIC